LERLSSLGYAGVEWFGDLPVSAKELRHWLDEAGLRMPSMHARLPLDGELDRCMDEAELLGTRQLFFSPKAEDFTDLTSLSHYAEKCDIAWRKMQPRGFVLGVHNHWWEWDARRLGAWLIDRCPYLSLEFDIYWLTVSGAHAPDMIQRYAPALRQLHVKDGPAILGQPMTAVGQGRVDIPAALQAARQSPHAESLWALVELDECAGDIWQALSDSRRYLLDHGLVSA
jgi:sugar phosphate isomerase/epimerase